VNPEPPRYTTRSAWPASPVSGGSGGAPARGGGGTDVRGGIIDAFGRQTRSAGRMPAPGYGGGCRPAHAPAGDAKTDRATPAVPPKLQTQPSLRRVPAFHRSPEQFPYIVARP
jgi:hypothetical protein